MTGQQPIALWQRPLPTFATVLRKPFVKLAVHLGAYILAPSVQFLFNLVFHPLALFFNHENFLQTLGKFPYAYGIQRPHHTYFINPQTYFCATLRVQTQIIQGLQSVLKCFTRGHNAKTRRGRINHGFVNAIGPAKSQRGIQLMINQTRFLGQGCIGPANIQTALGHIKIGGQHKLVSVGVNIYSGRTLHHIGHRLHANPHTGVATHRVSEHTEVENFLHIAWKQHRNHGRFQHMVRLVRQGRAFRGVVITGHQQYATVF